MYEASGVVREAFRNAGHNAWSLDIEPAADGSPFHFQMDAGEAMSEIEGDEQHWDMVIAHPMCTYVTTSAAWAYKDPDYDRFPDNGYHLKFGADVVTGSARRALRAKALLNMQRILKLPVPYIAMENPGRGFFNRIEKPTQIINPYEFGHDASKATGLWLRGLPPLRPTEMVPPAYYHDGKPRWSNQSPCGAPKAPPSKDRWRDRSETYQGIAEAMAAQWK